MRSTERSGQSQTLLDRLTASQARLNLKRILAGVSGVGLAAISVFGMLRLVSYLSAMWTWLPFVSTGFTWAISGTVLLVGLVGTVLRVRKTRPSLLVVAQRADRHFGLDERLSTALEFGMTEGRAAVSSPVLLALFGDAAARADQVNPKALVPLSIPRPAWYFLIVAAFLLALEIARPFSSSEAALVAATGTGVTADTETVDLILETAALLREEAEPSDEYMRVVAASLERLARDIAEERLSGAAIGTELARLVAHAGVALQAGGAGSTTDLASMTTASSGAAPQEESRSGSSSISEDDRERGQVGPSSPVEAETSLRESRAALENLYAQLGGQPMERDQLATGGPSSNETSTGRVLDAMHGETPAMETGNPAGPVAADMTLDEGVPSQATVGQAASPTGVPDAGQSGTPGTGQLAATPDQAGLPEASSSRDFELPSGGASRRRLPVEIVPETKLSSVLETSVPQGDWRQTAEEHVSSDFLGISYRGIASRYFLSLTQEPVAEAP